MRRELTKLSLLEQHVPRRTQAVLVVVEVGYALERLVPRS